MLEDLTLPLENTAQKDLAQRERDLFRLGHHGTHLDRLLGSTIPLEYFKSRALLFDVGTFFCERPVESRDIALDLIRAEDFILFRTGALSRNPYASPGYLKEFVEFSCDLLHDLLARKIRFIGLDCRGLRRNGEHREADLLCEKSGVFVIENMAVTKDLPEKSPFTIYAAWFDTDDSGIPCRVVAELA